MYSALPEHAISVHVGLEGERNRYRVDSPSEVRDLLAALVSGLAPRA
jgi:hypothetical protein